MAVTHDGFHAKDGWYFERQGDGSVKISAAVDRSTEVITLDPSSWASVVASMSAEGEKAQSCQRALAAQLPPES